MAPKRFDRDHQLATEMAVCATYGIPHSRFLGWDQPDRDKAIWWHVRQQETCPQCGTRPDEWDPEHGGARNAYSPEVRRCRGCEVRQRGEDMPEMKDNGRGLSVVLRRNPEVA